MLLGCIAYNILVRVSQKTVPNPGTETTKNVSSIVCSVAHIDLPLTLSTAGYYLYNHALALCYSRVLPVDLPRMSHESFPVACTPLQHKPCFIYNIYTHQP